MATDSPSPVSTESTPTSTQNTQYDKIGTKYNKIHVIPAVEPEEPSVIAALGDIRGKRCLDLACGTGRYTHLLHTLGASTIHGFDISPAMIAGARAAYPSSLFSSISFDVANCSKHLPGHVEPFDIIFAGWFLNYAGSEAELIDMFSVVRENLDMGEGEGEGGGRGRGRFVGITTNVDDPWMTEDKIDFYGLDVTVLEKEYRDPDWKESAEDAEEAEEAKVLGIKARVAVRGTDVQFDVFQFRREVYERCARRAGLRLEWRKPVVPDDERRVSGYWDRWVERPTFVVVEAAAL